MADTKLSHGCASGGETADMEDTKFDHALASRRRPLGTGAQASEFTRVGEPSRERGHASVDLATPRQRASPEAGVHPGLPASPAGHNQHGVPAGYPPTPEWLAYKMTWYRRTPVILNLLSTADLPPPCHGRYLARPWARCKQACHDRYFVRSWRVRTQHG